MATPNLVYTLRDQNRLEWENWVISYINQGTTKGEAIRQADERLLSYYEDSLDEREGKDYID